MPGAGPSVHSRLGCHRAISEDLVYGDGIFIATRPQDVTCEVCRHHQPNPSTI